MDENIYLKAQNTYIPIRHTKKSEVVPKEIPQQDLPEYQTSPETNAAYRSYGIALINKHSSKNNSIENIISRCEKSGIKYRLEKTDYQYNQYTLEILDKNLNPVKRMYWDLGIEASNFAGSEEYIYKDDKLVKIIEYNAEGKIHSTRRFY